ncbi:MAG TPA: GNAT family N-acetyltransferase [Bryobacteraceae bacterium]|nr:GNAT family N-acetyltransferase [Bryobacteraceae bacterium]
MLSIRRGSEEDLAAVAAIQSASPEAARWDPAGYLAYGFRVAVNGDRVAGFLVSRPLGLDEGELLNLAVEPESRRKGVGKALVLAFLGEFPGGAYLEVRESNTAALELYKSLGFKEVTRRPEYYDSPPEAAIVMKFHSC